MTTKPLYLIAVCFVLLVACVSAAPTMTSATATNSVATFDGTCGSPPCWFSWGSNTNYYWTTLNQTPSGGTFSDTQFGAPMLTGETYNVRACDSTGCSAPMAFAVPDATMLPITNYGADVIVIWRSGFNITQVADVVIKPYAMLMADEETWRGNGAPIVWGIFFFFVFVGYWLRGKSMAMPSILAVLSGTFLIGSSVVTSATGIQIAPAFIAAGIPLLIIGLAGMFFTWFHQ